MTGGEHSAAGAGSAPAQSHGGSKKNKKKKKKGKGGGKKGGGGKGGGKGGGNGDHLSVEAKFPGDVIDRDVVIHGTSKDEMNGLVGRATDYTEATKRFTVIVANVGPPGAAQTMTLGLKAGNLRLARKAQDLPPPPPKAQDTKQEAPSAPTIRLRVKRAYGIGETVVNVLPTQSIFSVKEIVCTLDNSMLIKWA